MSDHKMQVIIKSYDKTELRTEVSADEGKELIKSLNSETISKAAFKELLSTRIEEAQHKWYSRGLANDRNYHRGTEDALRCCIELLNQLESPVEIDNGVLERFELSLINEADNFFLYRDDLLGWIDLIKGAKL